MLKFTIQLARKGITISFVCIEGAVPGLTSGDISSDMQNLDFRFVTVPYPTLPAHTELHKLPRIERAKVFQDALEPVMDKFILDKSAGLHPLYHICFFPGLWM